MMMMVRLFKSMWELVISLNVAHLFHWSICISEQFLSTFEHFYHLGMGLNIPSPYLRLQLFMNSHWRFNILWNWAIPNIDLAAQNQFLSSCGIHICPWCVLGRPEWSLLCMFIWPFWNFPIHSLKCCDIIVPLLCICYHLAVSMDGEAYLCPWKQKCTVNFFAGQRFQFQCHCMPSYPLHIKEWTLVSSVACYPYYKSATPTLFQSKICG